MLVPPLDHITILQNLCWHHIFMTTIHTYVYNCIYIYIRWNQAWVEGWVEGLLETQLHLGMVLLLWPVCHACTSQKLNCPGARRTQRSGDGLPGMKGWANRRPELLRMPTRPAPQMALKLTLPWPYLESSPGAVGLWAHSHPWYEWLAPKLQVANQQQVELIYVAAGNVVARCLKCWVSYLPANGFALA